MELNTAKLTIERHGKFGFVYFEDGQLVHAEFEPEIGEKAVYRMLGLQDGQFKVEGGVKAPVRTIKTNWNNLLLEGLHQLDKAGADDEHRYFRLFERLLTIKGVIRAFMIDQEGGVISSTDGDEEVAEPALFALSALESEKFGQVLGLEPPKYINILVGPVRYVIVPYNAFYIVLEMQSKVKFDNVIPLLKQAIG
jgi:hypothetical protein